MHLDELLETGSAAVREIHDIFRSLQPQIARSGLNLVPLGDLETLRVRLEAELAVSNSPATWLGLVGAWCRKSSDDASISQRGSNIFHRHVERSSIADGPTAFR